MSEVAIHFRPTRRTLAWFALAVLLQVEFVRTIMTASPEEPFGLVLAGLLVTPFVLIGLYLSGACSLLLVPILIVVPGWALGFTLSEWWLLAALAFLMIGGLASGHLPRAPRSIEWMYGLYLAWAALAVFQAENTREALLCLKRLGVLYLAFVAGVRFLGTRHSLALVRSISILAIVIAGQLAVVVLGSGYGLQFLVTRSGFLTNLGWGYSNYVAAVAALTAAASLPLALHGRPRDRLLGAVGLLSATFVSLATLSRGGTLALLIAVMLATALEARRRFWVALGLIVPFAAVYLLSPLGQAGLERFRDPTELVSVGVRIAYYQETFRIVQENPILGVGPDQLPYHSQIDLDVNPHNFLLKNAADLGIPGLFLYLIILGLAAVRAGVYLRRATVREDRIPALSFVLTLWTGMANALYEPTLEGYAFGAVFWVMIGTFYAASEKLLDGGEISA